MQRLPISVAIIAGAEAARIGRALASVKEWASEIIVVLNEDVADGTEEIATQHGAKVFRETWKGHIAQKNSASDKASQPWIFGLDCDEEVSPQLRDEIARVMGDSNQTSKFSAFEFARCTILAGRWIRHGDWYPDRQRRLWKKGKARWGGIDPHDKLQIEGAIGRLSGELLHRTAESFDQLVVKTQIYAETFAIQYEQRGRRVGFGDLLIRPPWRFFRGYFLRLGFLDGWQGLSVAWMGAFYTWMRYAKAIERQQNLTGPPK